MFYLFLIYFSFNVLSKSSHDKRKEAQNFLFDGVDTDDDGVIELDEIAKYIELEVGFDSKNFVNNGILNVFENVVEEPLEEEIKSSKSKGEKAIVSNRKSNEINMNDLLKYWQRIGTLMTAQEVCDWICYAVQLPMYNSTFGDNLITGFDFPYLLEKNKDNTDSILESELNVTSKLHRSQIRRAIRMKLFGVGDNPPKPQSIHCFPGAGNIVVSWEEGIEDDVLKGRQSQKAMIPIHKYRIQARGFVFSTDYYGDSGTWTEWKELHHTNGFSYKHGPLFLGDTLQYRIQSWNIIGHSDWSKPIQCTVIQPPKIRNIAPISDEESNKLYAETLERVIRNNLSNNENNSSWSIMNLFYFIIDTYHAFSAFIQVCVALASLSALIYYVYHTYILRKPTNFEDLLEQSIDNIPIPVPEPSNNAIISQHISNEKKIYSSTPDRKAVSFLHRRRTSSNIIDEKNTIINEKKTHHKRNKTMPSIKRRSSLKKQKNKMDLNHCNVCKKKLGWKSNTVGWRYKHICHICHQAFCQKHGISPHIRGLPCGIPSRCTCNRCLAQKSINNTEKLKKYYSQ